MKRVSWALLVPFFVSLAACSDGSSPESADASVDEGGHDGGMNEADARGGGGHKDATADAKSRDAKEDDANGRPDAKDAAEPDAHEKRDASSDDEDAAMDAKSDSAPSDAGGDAAPPDASGDAAPADAGPSDASADAPSEAGANEGGDGAVTYVPTTIDTAVTEQLSPLELNQPATVEIGTYSFYPVELVVNPAQVTVPSGWVVSSVTENLAARDCPVSGTGGSRCRQYFDLILYADTACTFDGMYTFNWDVACVPGADCATIDPSFATFSVTANLTSEDFCSTLSAGTYAQFLPSTVFISPSTGTDPDPVTFSAFTTLPAPYVLTAGTAVPPAGFSFVSFTEDVGMRICDTPTYPNECRQWWNIAIDPGTSCNPRGEYSFTWNVGCATGGNCDPSLTTYTVHTGDSETRPLCPAQ